jgi:hypothetical protein
MVAQGVLDKCALFGNQLREVVEKVVESQSRLDGYDPEKLQNEMITAWREFEGSSSKLSQFAPHAAKFFGEGCWRNKSRWGWKEGMEPPLPRIYANSEESLLAKVRRQKAS